MKKILTIFLLVVLTTIYAVSQPIDPPNPDIPIDTLSVSSVELVHSSTLKTIDGIFSKNIVHLYITIRNSVAIKEDDVVYFIKQ